MNVLIVDDDAQLRTAIEALLNRAGYDHCSASTGAGALELLRTEAVDVVILDITLSGPMCGFEVAGRMLVSEGTAHIPIIILSGMPASEVAARAHHRANPLRQAVAVLEKPFDPAELLRLLRHAAGKTDPAPPPVPEGEP